MWEFLQIVFEFLTKQGGLVGFCLFISMSWIGYREWSFWKTKSLNKTNEGESKDKNTAQGKLLKQNADKIQELNASLLTVIQLLETFDKINKDYSTRIEVLTLQLKESNTDRVEDLKEVLSSYNSTMNDIAKTLEKIKFILEVRAGD